MKTIEQTIATTAKDYLQGEKEPPGRIAAVPTDTVDQGKICLGGAFRLPVTKAVG